MTTNKVQWLGSRVEWLGVVKDPTACNAWKQALSDTTTARAGLTDSRNQLTAAIATGKEAGADVSSLESQLASLDQQIAGADAALAQASQNVSNYCAEVTPSGPPPVECSATIPCADPNRECVNGSCVPKCGSGQTRDASGACVASAKSSMNWGLVGLAAAGAVGIGLAFAGLRKDLPKPEHRDNCPCGNPGCRC